MGLIRDITSGIRNGKEDSFNYFYELYADRIYRYLLVLSAPHEHIAREAMQETILRVLRYLKETDDEKVLWGYLRRMAKTSMIDIIRKHQRVSKIETSLDMICISNKEIENEDLTDNILMNALDKSMDEISDHEKSLIKMKYYDKLDYSKIAEFHTTTAKAIESKMGRLRQKLKDMIIDRLHYDK